MERHGHERVRGNRLRVRGLPRCMLQPQDKLHLRTAGGTPIEHYTQRNVRIKLRTRGGRRMPWETVSQAVSVGKPILSSTQANILDKRGLQAGGWSEQADATKTRFALPLGRRLRAAMGDVTDYMVPTLDGEDEDLDNRDSSAERQQGPPPSVPLNHVLSESEEQSNG